MNESDADLDNDGSSSIEPRDATGNTNSSGEDSLQETPLQPSDRRTESGQQDLTNQQLGDFRLLRRLGSGGMADVYLADQTTLSRRVAVKVLRRELLADDLYLKRFEQEAQAAGGLNHPNIVQVYLIGEADGVHFIAQEYVDGRNLRELVVRSGPPDLPVALRIMKQVSRALEAAGRAGIVHRDIKPENILISQKGNVKVTDFGLAQLTLSEERLHLTQDGMTLGTPMYMSPEQVSNLPVDRRSDIYSFGVTCYYMLSGRPPFRGETAMSVAVQHVNEMPEPLAELRVDLPPAICQIIERMMAKRPEDRYETAHAITQDLTHFVTAFKQQPDAVSRIQLPHVDTVPEEAETDRTGSFFGWNLQQHAVFLLIACLLVAAFFAVVGWLFRPESPL